MISQKHQGKARFAVLIGAMLTLTLLTLLFGLTWPVLLTQAGPTLPPIDPPAPPPPGPSDDDDSDDGDDTPPIAYIELQLQSAPAGAWSGVQWQDTAGGWHDVEGWQSSLPATGIQRWVVEAKDLNTGPFRWVVMRGRSGSIAGISDSFNLPAGANETVPVMVALQQ